MKKIFVILLALALVVTLVASTVSCAAPAQPTQTPAPTVKEIIFGLVTPLSGDAAPWGVLQKNCFETTFDEINAKGFTVSGQTYKWKMVSYDSRYESSEAVSAVTKLVADNVKYMSILGGSVNVACQGVTKPANVLVWGWAALGKQGLNEYTFQNQMEGEINSGAYPWLMKKYGVKNILMLFPNDETGKSYAEFSKFIADSIGLKTTTEFYERGTKDFYPILTRILANKPDCIDYGPTSPDTVPLITKQLYELGYKGIQWCSNSADPKLLMETAGAAASEGILIPLVAVKESPEKAAYKKEYVAKFGEAAWWDIGYLLHHGPWAITQAMEETQSLDPSVISGYLPTMTMKNHIWQPSQPVWAGKKYYGFDHIVLLPCPVSVMQNGNPVLLDELAFEKGAF